MLQNVKDKIIDLPHIPVMIEEMLQYLNPKEGESYLDTTFGAGGYSKAILETCACNVTAVDQDPNVEKFAKIIKDKYKDRFNFVSTNYVDAISHLKGKKFNGIVMDLGVSSMQLETANRGFSFMLDGPLDMRMSENGITASEFINNAQEKDIANVIYKYGDEVASRRIARKIVEERLISPINTTLRLANIVRAAVKIRGKIDGATKTFQAIRIYINQELDQLSEFLERVREILAPEGRLVIVSFHSLEDRIVKYYFREHAIKKAAKSKYSRVIEEYDDNKWMKILSTKVVLPSDKELKNNVRARSAKLRAIISQGRQ